MEQQNYVTLSAHPKLWSRTFCYYICLIFTLFSSVIADEQVLSIASSGAFDHVDIYDTHAKNAAIPYGLIHANLLYWDPQNNTFSPYIAQKFKLLSDSKICITLNQKARFNDGSPITVDDVIDSFNTANKSPKIYFKNVCAPILRLVKKNDHALVIICKQGHQHNALHSLCKISILKKGSKNNASSLFSGPYTPTLLPSKQTIQLHKVKDWWGHDLLPMKHKFKIRHIKFVYFKNTHTRRAALLRKECNFMQENSSKYWMSHFTNEFLNAHGLKKVEMLVPTSSLTLGFGFNLRRKKFQDIRVREALSMIFDFDTINRLFFHDLYFKSTSYFNGSAFSASGTPSPQETKILRNSGHPDNWIGFNREISDYSKLSKRQRITKALELLKSAGWVQKNNVLEKDGVPFEINMITFKKVYLRLLGVFRDDLEKIGIKLRIQLVDSSLYHDYMDQRNFDMVEVFIQHPPHLGIEQAHHWLQENNLLGLDIPSLDTLITRLDSAKSDQERDLLSTAIDRTLIWSFAMIPAWQTKYNRIICAKDLCFPKNMDYFSLFDVCASVLTK